MSETVNPAESINSLPLCSMSHFSNIVKGSVSEFNQSDVDNPLYTDFNMLLKDRHGVEIFRKFLEIKRAAHYLEFWFACQGFKAADSEKVYQLIKVIYRAYIRSESQTAVALQPNTKKNIVDKISSKQCLDQSIFDAAQMEIHDLLIKEFYIGFIKSESFKLYHQNSTSSDNSKSENTENQISSNNAHRETELSYVEYCGNNSSNSLFTKNKRERVNIFELSKQSVKVKQSNNGANKDRRSLAEVDPVSFVNQLSLKLEKFKIMQQCGRSLQPDEKAEAIHIDFAKTMDDDPQSILDNHCSFVMGKDFDKNDIHLKGLRMKKDPDIRSVVSQDSGVATTFETQNYTGNSQQIHPHQTYTTSIWAPPPRQYRHHHHHDHHHFRNRRRNKSEDQSVYSLEECTSAQLPRVIRKGKSQASDASSIFDSGVSSTYEHISHPCMVTSDRVSTWVNNHPGIVNTPAEPVGNMKRSCSAQTPGYKETINEGIESGPPGEVWIDECCINNSHCETPNPELSKIKNNLKGKRESSIIIGYFFCGDPVPYRTQVPYVENGFTLGQFKMLMPRRGSYRYFFKRHCDEFEGGGAVQEEYTRNEDILPLWEGKVIAKVEKIDPL